MLLLRGKARAIHARLVQEWSRILGLKWNRPLKFECDEEEANYITQPRDAIPIHQAMAQAMGPVTCKVFIDAFACVGGDTLAAMHEFSSANVYAVQLSEPARYAARFGRLTANVREFNRLLADSGGERMRARAVGTDIGSFLTHPQALYLSSADAGSILYLDPPWGVDLLNPERASPMEDIQHFLDTHVWKPLQKIACYPLLIVLKLPMEAEDIRAWPDYYKCGT